MMVAREINWDQIREAFKCQLTIPQAAATHGVSGKYLLSEFKKHFPGELLNDYKKDCAALGTGCLRQRLMKKALKDDHFAALKFALQNYEGMTEKTETKTSFDLVSAMEQADKVLGEDK